MVLPVPHFRTDKHLVALEGAFADHLRMMRRKIGDAAKLVIASPQMADANYEKSKSSLSLINEAEEQIAFQTLFAQDGAGSNQARIRLFWPVMRSIYYMVQQSCFVHSGSSSHSLLPFELASILWGIRLKRCTVFVMDIDYRNSAYMSYREGNWSLKSYILCRYIYDSARYLQLRIASRYCSLVLLKGDKLARDFGKGRPNVKSFLDASHSEENIIDGDSLGQKIQAILGPDLPLRLVYFGRLTAYKGVDRCLRAVARARQAGSNVTFDIVGDGEEAAALGKLAQALNANEFVNFHGARPFDQDFFRLLYEFHLLLAAPLREDTPRSALDAMAAGIPYLAFDTYYYQQLIESGAGEVVPWADAEAMQQAIVRLEKNRGQVARMAENGVAFARANTQEIWLDRRLAWTMDSWLNPDQSAAIKSAR